jgi:hypothetical protein
MKEETEKKNEASLYSPGLGVPGSYERAGPALS